MSERPRHPWLAVVASGFLPGALWGAHFAGLLFFLNPSIPFAAATVVRGVLSYGLIFGAASLAVLAPFLWRRPRRAVRLLPWGITAALAAAALLDWSHASYYAYYLPPGINVRLIKAALWLTLSALVLFYTALLHSLSRRRYGPRSRAAFVVLSLVTVYAALERREAFQPPVEPPGRPAVFEAGERPRLIVVGLDAATLDALLPLARQGVLPFVARILDGGAHGHLQSLTPNRVAPLWTTLATGKLPHKHGVIGRRLYPAPLLGDGVRLDLAPAFRPLREWSMLSPAGRRVDARDRRVLALWEILSRLGVATGIVGWPATSPVSGELRFALSDRYFADPATAGGAAPAEIAERGRLFVVRPADLGPPELGAFGGAPPEPVLAALAEDRWRESLTAFLLDQQRDLGAVFLMLPGLRQVSRAYFGGYSAAEFEAVQRPPYAAAAGWVRGYYAFLDQALEGLWEGQEGPALLAVVSAYGAEPASGWQRVEAEMSEEHALQGHFRRSPDGAFLLYGAGVASGGRIPEAHLVDVAPTLLYGLGFPIARDLDGQVRREAFAAAFLARHPQVFLPTYEILTAEGGAHGPP